MKLLFLNITKVKNPVFSGYPLHFDFIAFAKQDAFEILWLFCKCPNWLISLKLVLDTDIPVYVNVQTALLSVFSLKMLLGPKVNIQMLVLNKGQFH